MADKPVMHYTQLFEFLHWLESVSTEDLETLRVKPDSTDRAADSAWRRCARRNGIDTSARKCSGDAEYHREYRAKARIRELEGQVAELRDRCKSAEAAVALAQVHGRHRETVDLASEAGLAHATVQWLALFLCDECSEQLDAAVKHGAMCEGCRRRLVAVMKEGRAWRRKMLDS